MNTVNVNPLNTDLQNIFVALFQVLITLKTLRKHFIFKCIMLFLWYTLR